MSQSAGLVTVYVRMVDGATCFAPVPAVTNPDGTLRLLDNSEFDPEDTATLLEFIPGDVVKTEVRPVGSEASEVLLAIKLVGSTAADRDYWAVLFALAHELAIPSLPEDQLARIAGRIRQEIDAGNRWHYPMVAEWARKRE